MGSQEKIDRGKGEGNINEIKTFCTSKTLI